MLKLAVNANEVADESLNQLEAQEAEIKKQQDEVASMADQINVADRKIKGIRSFFSHLGNHFKKDNSGEHQKARQKYEKELAKENFRNEAEKQKLDEEKMDQKIHANNLRLVEATERDAQQLQQAKLQSHQELKAIKRGGNTAENNLVLGKFVFQENEIGEQCEAEDNLDEVAKQVKSLIPKAETMTDFVKGSSDRIEQLNVELNDVQQRTVAATKKGEKIVKKDTFL